MGDAADPSRSSGYPFWMRQGFLDMGCTVIDAFPLNPERPKWLRFKSIQHRLKGEYYTDNRSPAALRRMAAAIERAVAGRHVDFVFSLHTAPVSTLDLGVPIVVVHDQTFRERLAYFAYEARPPAQDYVDEALAQEGLAYRNADLCAFPSQRSLDSIAAQYDVSPAKLLLVPWGANLAAEPARETVHELIDARAFRPLQIIFVGVEWQRKGGPVMMEACRILRERGVDISLLIIGCEPALPLPHWVTVVPKLDKRVPEQAAEYDAYLRRAHLLFLPSRVEAYGHVFCEAAAYGVPAVATDVGGIPTIVQHDVTGLCLPLDSPPTDFADAIGVLVADPARYRRLSRAARDRYEQKLNWRAFCGTIVEQALRIAGERPEYQAPMVAAE